MCMSTHDLVPQQLHLSYREAASGQLRQELISFDKLGMLSFISCLIITTGLLQFVYGRFMYSTLMWCYTRPCTHCYVHHNTF